MIVLSQAGCAVVDFGEEHRLVVEEVSLLAGYFVSFGCLVWTCSMPLPCEHSSHSDIDYRRTSLDDLLRQL